MDIITYICLILALYSVVRLAFEPEIMRKLLYFSVFGFAISGSLVMIFPDILTLIATCAFLIGDTLESNALASAYAQRNDQ
jgi:energy-converting hydrogenase A subunit C